MPCTFERTPSSSRTPAEIWGYASNLSYFSKKFSQHFFFADEYNRDKRSLSEEIVELRKQLDDVGPELSRKQALYAQLNADFQETAKRLRASQRNAEMLEAQVSMLGCLTR